MIRLHTSRPQMTNAQMKYNQCYDDILTLMSLGVHFNKYCVVLMLQADNLNTFYEYYVLNNFFPLLYMVNYE